MMNEFDRVGAQQRRVSPLGLGCAYATCATPGVCAMRGHCAIKESLGAHKEPPVMVPKAPPWPPKAAEVKPEEPKRPVEHELGLSLPDADEVRGDFPMATGALDYFPNAFAYLAWVSKVGNDQHNPGEPMHWARDKSTDHADKVIRHLVDRGKKDSRGVRHTGRAAWRIMAMLQTELEDELNLVPARASKNHPRAADFA